MTDEDDQHVVISNLQWELTRLRTTNETMRSLIVDLIGELEKVGVSYLRALQLDDLKNKILYPITETTEEALRIG